MAEDLGISKATRSSRASLAVACIACAAAVFWLGVEYGTYRQIYRHWYVRDQATQKLNAHLRQNEDREPAFKGVRAYLGKDVFSVQGYVTSKEVLEKVLAAADSMYPFTTTRHNVEIGSTAEVEEYRKKQITSDY